MWVSGSHYSVRLQSCTRTPTHTQREHNNTVFDLMLMINAFMCTNRPNPLLQTKSTEWSTCIMYFFGLSYWVLVWIACVCVHESVYEVYVSYCVFMCACALTGWEWRGEHRKLSLLSAPLYDPLAQRCRLQCHHRRPQEVIMTSHHTVRSLSLQSCKRKKICILKWNPQTQKILTYTLKRYRDNWSTAWTNEHKVP